MNEPKLRFPEFKDIWNNHKIEDMFDRVGTPVDLDDTLTYREIGIRSHGKGIFHKDETTASEIGNKRVFWVEPDCFVVNIVFAWERAVAKTTEAENGMIASHRFPMYKPKKDVVDLDYITEYFITKRGQNVLILASPGGAGRNKTLGQKEFAKSVVKLPSLPEQQKIAEFLSTIDTVIEKQKETVSAWEERKKGVMQKLFSQEVRFKADDGSNFPEWEEKKLGDCCSLITKGTTPKEYPENGDVNFVRIDCIENGSINISKCLKINEQIHNGELARSVLKENDLLCSIAGALGVVTVVTKDVLPANTNQALAILRLYESENVQYISKTLSSYIMEKYIRECKTVGAQPNLSLGQMRDLIIPYPCSEEQQKIADCLSSLDEVIEKQKVTLSAWEELKKGLLQQMFV